MRRFHIIYEGGYEPELLSVGQVVVVLSDNKPNLLKFCWRNCLVEALIHLNASVSPSVLKFQEKICDKLLVLTGCFIISLLLTG